MSMHVNLTILHIYFLWYQENAHPENFHQSKSPWWIPPRKIPTWNIPILSFKYFYPSFLIFFVFCIIVAIFINITEKAVL